MTKLPMIAMALLLSLTQAASAQDQSPAVDVSGKGAVLCLQEMLVATIATAEVCKWDRTPADDAINAALGDIDAFILANETPALTKRQVDDYRAGKLKKYERVYSQGDYCTVDSKDGDSPAALPWMFHNMEPSKLSALVADSLSVPRQPLMNPCL